jgi:hypothetical protein
LCNFWRTLPIDRQIRAKVQEVFNSRNPKKTSGYNLITGTILKELPIIGIKYITPSCLKDTSRRQWKVAQIILILNPGKPPNELTSYRSISALAIESKVFKKLLLKRLLPMVEKTD